MLDGRPGEPQRRHSGHVGPGDSVRRQRQAEGLVVRVHPQWVRQIDEREKKGRKSNHQSVSTEFNGGIVLIGTT